MKKTINIPVDYLNPRQMDVLYTLLSEVADCLDSQDGSLDAAQLEVTCLCDQLHDAKLGNNGKRCERVAIGGRTY